MKKIILVLVGLFLFSLTLVNNSCKKPDPDANSEDTTEVILNEKTVEDASYATDIYGDVISDVLVKTDENSSEKKSMTETCADISLLPVIGYPKTLTIDYGTTGCEVNGHTITGKITAEISGRLRVEGSTVSISFTDFSVDTLAVTGTIALTMNSVDLSDNTIDFSTSLTNCALTMPSGNISMNGTMDITWNINTLSNYEDDTFEITSGDFTGTNKRGKSFTGTVLTTLLYPVSCGTIVSGQLKLETSESNFPATIDFGNGTCDNTAMVYTTIEYTVGNQTFTKDYSYEITLP